MVKQETKKSKKNEIKTKRAKQRINKRVKFLLSKEKCNRKAEIRLKRQFYFLSKD